MKTTLLTFFLLITTASAPAQYDYGFSFSKAGTAGLQFLKIPVNARDAALADASTSLTNDASAMFVNPGGLALATRPQAYLGHDQWLAGSRLDAAAVSIPAGSFVFGVSLLRFAIEDFEETTVQQPAGTGRMVSAGDIAIGLAAGRRFTDRLTIGLQFRFVQEKLDDRAMNNILFDVGAVYYTGFHNLRLAFALQHFGPDMRLFDQNYRTPLLFRVSAGEDFLLTEDQRLTSAVDLIHPTDNNEWVNWGVEYEFLKTFALRAGYRFGVDRGNVAFGAGIKPPEFGSVALSFDYAYSKFDAVFGGTQRITLGLAF
jgi:hypothetical protein